MEFQEVMKQWKRRCKHCTDEDDDGCNIHSIACDCFCSMKNFADFALIEKEIMAWAAKNPEPVYPTWADYISTLVVKDICTGKISGPDTVLTYAMKTHIPADLAQKLGVEPKEDV